VTSPDIVEVPRLSDNQAVAIRRMVDAAGAAGNPPISERGLLHLQAGAPFRHFLAIQRDQPLGYAQLDTTDTHAVAELVAEGSGDVGFALLSAVDAATAGQRLLLWAHGASSAANQAAHEAGLRPVRSLLQMRRSLTDLQLSTPSLPPDVAIRPFVAGQDDAAWLAVNARAFADHPEQGSWTQSDLDDRLRSDWFDPAGFLIAEKDGELLGYHWTKVHDASTGEVYVLGVAPEAQGLKLGRSLLTAGLAYLRQRGLSVVLLYADESNIKAVRLYTALGFTVFSTDVQYARSDHAP
jgi:mycothiol synthase